MPEASGEIEGCDIEEVGDKEGVKNNHAANGEAPY